MLCPHCQADNIPAASFCQGCGAGLPKKRGGVFLVLLVCLGLAAVGLLSALLSSPRQSPDEAIAQATLRHTETPAPRLSMAVFEGLSMGMSYGQVVERIGPGQEIGRNQIGGYETVMYQWHGGFMQGITLMFQNGKLIQKNQIGLN